MSRRALLLLLSSSLSLFDTSSCWTVPPREGTHASFRRKSTLMHVIEPKKPDMDTVDLTGGRPGAIIETEEQLKRKEEILKEIPDRNYPSWIDDYGELEEDAVGYDIDDPDAIDSSTLGTYDIFDLKSKFDYEWDPESGDPDPNNLSPELEYVTEPEKDEQGIEVGWDPIYGPSNPIDTRTIVTPVDSYMIADDTRDDAILEPVFPDGDLELGYNQDVVSFRKSLRLIETYVDEFLGSELEVPRHVAKWHGYPEQMEYPERNYTNNRFTAPEDLTDFDALGPYRARKRAVELARAKNCEWLPEGKSEEYHRRVRQPYEDHGTLVGTLRKGDVDETILQEIAPALKILGSCAELLSIQDTVFRFHYHGLMKNRAGMAAWTETLIKDCDVECTGVVFETGFRRRDPAYDGGDPWYGPY